MCNIIQTNRMIDVVENKPSEGKKEYDFVCFFRNLFGYIASVFKGLITKKSEIVLEKKGDSAANPSISFSQKRKLLEDEEYRITARIMGLWQEKPYASKDRQAEIAEEMTNCQNGLTNLHGSLRELESS